MSLIWIDLETTGISSAAESVLEVAAIATDDALNVLGTFARVIYYPLASAIVEAFAEDRAREAGGLQRDIYFKTTERRVANTLRAAHSADIVNPFVLAMHDVNGLWKDCIHGQALDTVDRDLASFIKEHGVRQLPKTNPETQEVTFVTDLPQLAGSTISFDRSFLDVHMKRAAAQLNYRNVDVSSFNETAKRFWPSLYEARPRSKEKAHRGMADIVESIALYTHYLSHLTRGLAPAAPVLTSMEFNAICTAVGYMDRDEVAAYTKKTRKTLDDLMERACLGPSPATVESAPARLLEAADASEAAEVSA